MFTGLGPLGPLLDVALVLLGFGLIIVVHELGHFLAARWAGVRVLAFAVGFGPALFSYRKGLGLTRGSSEPRYLERLKAQPSAHTSGGGRVDGLCPTEYRLNLLPLGGYVKMLGQVDLQPGMTSDAPDGYQAAPAWKRMIIISAGVVMNIVLAAVLFVLVFGVGLKVPPPVIGDVIEGSPAAVTAASNADALGIGVPGLQPGDEVLFVNGREAHRFEDIMVAAAMASRADDIELEVMRRGIDTPLQFAIDPETDPLMGLQAIGVQPVMSSALTDFAARTEGDRAFAESVYEAEGLRAVPLGARLVEIDGQPVAEYAPSGFPLTDRVGQDIDLVFEHEGTRYRAAQTVEVGEQMLYRRGRAGPVLVRHALWLDPVAGVQSVQTRAADAGLREGDVFVRVGSQDFPTVEAAREAISREAGGTVEATVLRDDELVQLELPVNEAGTVGFALTTTRQAEPYIAGLTGAGFTDVQLESRSELPAEAFADLPPGTRVVSVNGLTVETFGEVLAEARRAARDGVVSLSFVLQPPTPGAGAIERRLELTESQARELESLPAVLPVLSLFEPAEVLLKAEGPVDAVLLGLSETKRSMAMVYLTFARLAEGTVRVTDLRGPVGIVHIGSLIADRGLIAMLFFFAVISVNLAVINFLPLPIVDGGQFLMLVYEQVRGKPMPIVVQNLATLAGLALIISVFLIVTFNDVLRLFG